MIGTLFNGEKDWEHCKKSVEEQNCDCAHIVFSGLPEVAAHKQLYRTFANSDFDYLVKLDADMVLKDSDTVRTMVDFIRDTQLWRVTFLADDHFTRQAIQGVHIFNRKVKWWYSQFVENDLRSDRVDNLHRPEWYRKLLWPWEPTRTKLVETAMVDHAKYADEWQGFSFAYRRVFKRSQHLWPAFLSYCVDPERPALQGMCRGIMAAAETQECDLKDLKNIFEEFRNTEIDTGFIRGAISTFKGDTD